MPMKFVLSSPFGELSEVRDFRPHTGIDIPLEVGTKLRSFVDGTVERVISVRDGLGKHVIIRGEDGNAYIYGHLEKITVHKGDTVRAGMDIIGLSGNTGHSTGPHLHFAIQTIDGKYVDPAPVIKALESVTGADPMNMFIGSQPVPGGLMDWLNKLSDGVVGKEREVVQTVSNPVWAWIKAQMIDLGHWFVANLPDIMGYGAILAAVCIILGSMAGKGGILKPLAIYAGLLILALCILGG
ncbi:M23 family metallopeptidase [Paenibacillus alkaliterrae]|uniref:M23 family metallopeptidase n=1 Tax=Paenibacillus alkaliterrae TaxID=320909 RepID=UPI001F2F0CC2|nr:M23 family metallopeptidase [Paenibacillus alkaliterrae]MCF2939058.1 M23 family metallopeptidase [Paenibacillus alkaliterrae]